MSYSLFTPIVSEVSQYHSPLSWDLFLDPDIGTKPGTPSPLDSTNVKRAAEDVFNENPASPPLSLKFRRTDKMLGHGAYGIVLEGTTYQGSPVAIKIHFPHPGMHEAALRESDILSLHATHKTPHSLPLRAAYPTSPKKLGDGDLCPMHRIVTDKIEGDNLYKAHLASKATVGPLSPIDVRTITKALFEFLAHSNQIDTAHLDLKAENIMFQRKARTTTILDYGISEKMSLASPTSLRQTSTERCPEEILRFGDMTAPPRNGTVDVWSIGCILYHMVVGHELFYIQDTPDLDVGFKDHLQMIADQIGAPNRQFLAQWKNSPKFYTLSGTRSKIKNPNPDLVKDCRWQKLADVAKARGFSSADISFILDILKKTISYTRPTAAELLTHPYFQNDISFHMTGNFSPHDIITIYRASEVKEDHPDIVIDTSTTKMDRLNCHHIPRDPDNMYLVTVERGGDEIYSNHVHFINGETIALSLQPVQHIVAKRSLFM